MDELVRTGEYSRVNKRFLSEEGLKQAMDFGSITSDTLVSQTPLQIPETKQGTSADAMTGLAQGLLDTTSESIKFADSQQEALKTQQTKVSEAETQKRSLMDRLLGVSGEQARLEEDAGIDELTKNVTEARKQVTNASTNLTISQRAQTNELRALEGTGMTDEQKNNARAEINRKYAFEQADMSLSLLVARAGLESTNLDLATAQSIIDRKIELIKEPLELEYGYISDFLDRNYDVLDKKEQRVFEAQQSTLDRKLKEIDEFKATQRELLQLAASQGAPASVIANIGKANTMEEAIIAAGQYSGDVLAREIKAEQLAELRKKNIPITPDVENADDPFIQSLLNTEGGKDLTGTAIEKLDKGLTVLGQLGVLQSNIEGMKTGPIVGAFKSANPWDTQAQTIKASLNSIVPNLARGVYGEVGVLTDNDIRTYSRTIPNLKSTEEVRNAILYITLDMIGKSIKNTLMVNAAANRDVSGFVDIYTEMENTKNSILSAIPGAQVPQAFKGSETPQNADDPLGIF